MLGSLVINFIHLFLTGILRDKTKNDELISISPMGKNKITLLYIGTVLDTTTFKLTNLIKVPKVFTSMCEITKL